jgi:trigger factor
MSDTTSGGGGLQVTVEQPSSYVRRLSITVPAERVKRIRQSVRARLTQNARVPGFRKGKLPDHLIEKQFGPAIDQETVDRVVQETYPEALKQGDVNPIAGGEVADVHYHGQGGELHYLVDVEVQPTLELARTSGFVIARPSDSVGDEEVDAVIERLRSERATQTVVDDRTPDFGDEVQVRITAPRPAGEEGEPEPQEYRFVMGEGQAIAPIEEAIMSLTPGEERGFDIAYPEDFDDPDLAGTTQRLTIGVVELKARELPELDDAFAQAVSNGTFENVEALRSRIASDLREDARRRAETAVREGLIGQILEANPIEAPRSMVERYLDYMMGEGDGRRQKPKRSPEQEERFSQFREMMRSQAESAVKRVLVVEALANQQGLRATQDEVDSRVELIAQAHGRSPSDVWLELEKTGQLQGLEGEITEEKVFDWLRAQNTVG